MQGYFLIYQYPIIIIIIIFFNQDVSLVHMIQ